MQISPVVGSADWWLFSRDSIATLILTLPDEEELGVDEDGENIVSYDYSARLKVTDASNYPSFYNFMTVTITRDVPEPAEVENFEGDVDTIDEMNGRVTVMINIFGRSTPVELEHWQIEKL